MTTSRSRADSEDEEHKGKRGLEKSKRKQQLAEVVKLATKEFEKEHARELAKVKDKFAAQDEYNERIASAVFNLPGHTPIIRYNGKTPLKALSKWQGTVFPLVFNRPDFWLMNILHVSFYILNAYVPAVRAGIAAANLGVEEVSFTLALTTFFVVLYSQTAAARFANMYEKACAVSEGVQEICIWVACYFPGPQNRTARWEIARQACGAQFILFLSLNGQTMDERNWGTMIDLEMITETELVALQKWDGPPFHLVLLKALENARLALHARQEGRPFDLDDLSKSEDGRMRNQGARSKSAPKSRASRAEVRPRAISTPKLRGPPADARRHANSMGTSLDRIRTRGEGGQWDEREGRVGLDADEPDTGGFVPIRNSNIEPSGDDDAAVAVQYSEILGLCFKLKSACQKVYNDNSNPPPFSYYHVLNFMIILSGMALAYALISINSPLSILVNFFVNTVIISLREVSSDMGDPFAGDDGDFPIATWLKRTLDLLISTTYMDTEQDYMSAACPLPRPDLVETSFQNVTSNLEKGKKFNGRFSPPTPGSRAGTPKVGDSIPESFNHQFIELDASQRSASDDGGEEPDLGDRRSPERRSPSPPPMDNGISLR